MMTKPSSSKTAPEDILRDHPLEIQAIANRLRSLLKELVPEASEKAYLRWRGIGYRHPAAGYFCGIFPQQGEGRLLFDWGVLLPDPDGHLSGEGRQVRYLSITDLTEVVRAAITALIQAALALPDRASVKRRMVKGQT